MVSLEVLQIGGLTQIELILLSVVMLLIIITAALGFVAARRFAGGLATGTLIIATGVILVELSFSLGIADHIVIAGGQTPLAHPAWVHETTIILGLLFFLLGFIFIYRTAVRVAKEHS